MKKPQLPRMIRSSHGFTPKMVLTTSHLHSGIFSTWVVWLGQGFSKRIRMTMFQWSTSLGFPRKEPRRRDMMIKLNGMIETIVAKNFDYFREKCKVRKLDLQLLHTCHVHNPHYFMYRPVELVHSYRKCKSRFLYLRHCHPGPTDSSFVVDSLLHMAWLPIWVVK